MFLPVFAARFSSTLTSWRDRHGPCGLSSQGEHSNEPVLFLCVCVRVNYYYDWCWCRPFASKASDRTSQPEKKLDAAAKECRPMLLKQQVSGGAFWHML